MKRKLRLLLAVVLAMTMFMGLSITSFAATVALQNPKTIGVQLIDDTLIIQEDHHNFFAWGKSVMIQCPGVTDILPNNITDMMDIQFDGNLYKGIKEVIIVSSPEKNDKVHLEEGSMIITGVTTLNQLQNIKTAMLSRPNTLVELKSVLTGASKYLSTTKNYIIGKNNEVLNETGSRVAKKELQGTAELVTDEDVVHAVVEEATSSDSESKPVEEKKDPTPTPTPGCPLASTHGSLHVGKYCAECDFVGTVQHTFVDNHEGGHVCSCGIGDDHHYNFVDVYKHKCTVCNMEASHAWNDDGQDSSHICSGCSDTQQHTYEKGICNVCGHICTHKEQTEGELCSHCSTRVPYTCEEDHSAFCQGKMCDVCEKPGTGDHAWSNGICSACNEHCNHPSFERAAGDAGKHKHKCSICDVTGEHDSVEVEGDDDCHKCSVCGNLTMHTYGNGVVCEKCNHTCTHSGYSAGQTCNHCWIDVP